MYTAIQIDLIIPVLSGANRDAFWMGRAVHCDRRVFKRHEELIHGSCGHKSH